MTEERQKRLSEIDEECETLRDKLRNLYIEHDDIIAEDYNAKIRHDKMYKIDYYGDIYVGRIYKIWYSKYDESFMVDFCGLRKSFTEFNDEAFCEFDAGMQLNVGASMLDEFIENLKEISEEEFKDYLEEWISESEANIKKWFNVEE